MQRGMGWSTISGGIHIILARMWRRISKCCGGFSTTSKDCAKITACKAKIWRRVHSIILNFRIRNFRIMVPPKPKKIVLLGREDSQTAIVYNSLRSEVSIERVIVELAEPRLKFLK